jgi:hypothetical protein
VGLLEFPDIEARDWRAARIIELNGGRISGA